MNVGEFFVLLGVKGDDKSKKAIGGVDTAIKDVKNSSVAAKIAILGVVYGLERMMSQSMQAGTGLKQFADFTGLSAVELQKWQYAGRQFGVGADEIASGAKTVQSAMAQMRMGMGAPAGMSFLDQVVGLENEKVDDAFYMLGKLQEFAKKVQTPMANEVLKSFGLSEKMIAAMRNNAFNPEAFAKAQVYSTSAIDTLNKSNAMWSNLGDKMQKMFGNFTVKNGPVLISNITKLADVFVKLADSLTNVIQKYKLFDLIGQSIIGWTQILDAMSGKKPLEGDFSLKGIGDFFKGMQIEDQERFEQMLKDKKANPEGGWLQDLIERRKGGGSGEQKPTSSIQINQELNFNGNGDNAAEVALENQRVLNQTVRQLTAQGQVS